MLLEAQAKSCFSSVFLLKMNGRSVGRFQARWASETIDVALVERRRLRFEKVGWFGSHFKLIDESDETTIGEADRSGLFTSSWNLELGGGPMQMEREGWFATGYVVTGGKGQVARVDRAGACERGWFVEGTGLREENLLLTGLVYHTIRRREASQHAAGGHGAGS